MAQADGWWNYVETDINNWKITNWKERTKDKADWKKSIKEANVSLDCSAIEEEEEKKERKKEEGERVEEEGGGKFEFSRQIL